VPETTVFFYKDDDGTVPLRTWLEQLRKKDKKAFARCVASIQRLALFGHELRRPNADFLRDGIYELRATKGRVNYRVLYFFRWEAGGSAGACIDQRRCGARFRHPSGPGAEESVRDQSGEAHT